MISDAGTLVKTLTCSSDPISSLYAASSMIATSHGDGHTRIWDTRSRNDLHFIHRSLSCISVTCVSFVFFFFLPLGFIFLFQHYFSMLGLEKMVLLSYSLMIDLVSCIRSIRMSDISTNQDGSLSTLCSVSFNRYVPLIILMLFSVLTTTC